ncbi:hypothetical protein EDD11_007691 [Mortierella claussenii]|nr:hypothetical protein EDD11_007691 [Mortierella claussenii]
MAGTNIHHNPINAAAEVDAIAAVLVANSQTPAAASLVPATVLGTVAGTASKQPNTADILQAPPKDPFQGDGVDPAHAAVIIPEQSALDWITYIVSLSYNKLATSVFSSVTRWHWYDSLPHTSLILGAVPSQHLLVQLQRENRVEDIVNMCAEFRGHMETMRELGLVQCWIPTRDFHTPSLQNIWIGVKFIEKCERQWQELEDPSGRGKLYLHCKAGKGRSATVALCWLVYQYALTVDKDLYLRPEVIAFDCEVQELENSHSITREAWPGSVYMNNGPNMS